MKRSAKIALGFAAAGALAAAAFIMLAVNEPPSEVKRGIRLAGVDWLPAEASDVTYAKREGFGWFICYECSLPREALNRMSQKEGWMLEPKNEVSVDFIRWELSPLTQKAETNVSGVIELSQESAIPKVKNALFYENRHPNGGGITVVYDLNAGRLLVHESHR